MTDLHDATLRAGFWGFIESRAKELKNAAREELRALPFGDGKAAKVGDEILCKASWSKGSTKIVVADEAALLAWVKEKHPTEIVESVNDAFRNTFKAVDGVVIDMAGEAVPGMEVRTGAPTLSVRSEKGAASLVAKLVSSGQMTLDGAAAVEPVVVEGEVGE